VNKDD